MEEKKLYLKKIGNQLIDKYGKENIDRISGSTRYETAVLVEEEVRKLTGNSSSAILVDGTNFPDAIAMTSMGIGKDMPILLSTPNTLNSSTEKALKDWNINNIVIGGGEAAISKEIENKLSASMKIERIFGADRYSTAAKIAEEAYPNSENIVMATGELFPDAIVGAIYGAKNGYPIILSNNDNVPETVMDYINK